MTFQWPSALVLLLVVAALAVAYVLVQRRRHRYALRYANVSLVRRSAAVRAGVATCRRRCSSWRSASWSWRWRARSPW